MLPDRSFQALVDSVASDPVERRDARRIPFETDVRLSGDGHVLSCVSTDVSCMSIFLASYRVLPEGTHVSVAFRLPTGYVRGGGVVRRVREGRPGTMAGMAIDLCDLEEVDRESLRRFCEQRPRFLTYDEIVAAKH
jgi:hypothetical protein